MQRLGRFDMLGNQPGVIVGKINFTAAKLTDMQGRIARRVQLKRRAARRAFKRFGRDRRTRAHRATSKLGRSQCSN